jgi:hypothetical protein
MKYHVLQILTSPSQNLDYQIQILFDVYFLFVKLPQMVS